MMCCVLNLNSQYEKKPPDEEIIILYAHDTINNFFLAKGFSDSVIAGKGFPEWLSGTCIQMIKIWFCSWLKQ